MLLLLVLATFGLWVISSADIVAPLWDAGAAHRVWFGSMTYPDALRVLVFAAWLFLLARFICSVFTGASAKRFRWAAVILAVALFLYSRGVFIESNLTPRFIILQLILTAVVAAASLYGLHGLTRSSTSSNGD